MECKLTPAQRKECYEWVLEELKEPTWATQIGYPFMCIMVSDWVFTKEIPVDWGEIEVTEAWLPELAKYRPTDTGNMDGWFPTKDIQSRISCLEASLILLKEKHPELWQND